MPVVLVALGGALGAVARFLIGSVFARRTDTFYGTLFINLTGCVLIAAFFTATGARQSGWRYFFPIGFVGAYTTFSTFEWETLRLIEAGRAGTAFAYVAASNLLGCAAVFGGAWLGRRL